MVHCWGRRSQPLFLQPHFCTVRDYPAPSWQMLSNIAVSANTFMTYMTPLQHQRRFDGQSACNSLPGHWRTHGLPVQLVGSAYRQAHVGLGRMDETLRGISHQDFPASSLL